MMKKFNTNLPAALRSRVSRGQQWMYGLAGLMAAPFAFAQAADNTSAIKAVFDSYKEDAIELSIAFAIVLWTLKGTGLLKPRS